ncbi:MAG: 5-(carboxyamino)imidazole ribonucleotide mutase [Lachnospiraceae bacterium]|nr:5-(carboxyamino)imidazole ribonucleotide mutase [Lachnospiraceae bacterium]
MSAEVVILMGSDSDLPVMSESAKILEKFGIEYEISIISAHRTPDRFVSFVSALEEREVKVLIAGAGGAAHLPGMAAALTAIPVVGVPIKTAALGGVDSLYSIVQMPSGIPVATVAINGAANAAILAAKMIALGDPDLKAKLKEYSKELGDKVNAKAARLESIGWEAYLGERSV